MKMINVIVPLITSRLAYTAAVIFQHIFRVSYRFCTEDEMQEAEISGNFYIEYTRSPVFLSRNLFIPDTGFLTFGQATAPIIDKSWGEPSEKDLKGVFPFDLFSVVFYFISDFEKYRAKDRDKYGRYKHYYNVSEEIFPSHRPWVFLFCEKLIPYFPDYIKEEILKNRKYRPEITWDIDNPWKYRHKSFFKIAGGMLREVFMGKRRRVIERIQALFLGKDVNDTYSEVFSICPPSVTVFFFLVGGDSPQDSAFSFKTPALRKLIKRVADLGYKTGIHPSFETWQDVSKMASEIQNLTEITGIPIVASRQHFLRYILPLTFRNLLSLGIKEEYSYCFYDTMGFPNGMMIDYPWYDLEKEEITELWVCPSVMMDRAWVSYMKGSDSEKMIKFDNILSEVKHFGGVCRVIFHNEALSESDEWEYKRDIFKQVIKKILS